LIALPLAYRIFFDPFEGKYHAILLHWIVVCTFLALHRDSSPASALNLNRTSQIVSEINQEELNDHHQVLLCRMKGIKGVNPHPFLSGNQPTKIHKSVVSNEPHSNQPKKTISRTISHFFITAISHEDHEA
jgi:hypothetical protein